MSCNWSCLMSVLVLVENVFSNLQISLTGREACHQTPGPSIFFLCFSVFSAAQEDVYCCYYCGISLLFSVKRLRSFQELGDTRKVYGTEKGIFSLLSSGVFHAVQLVLFPMEA